MSYLLDCLPITCFFWKPTALSCPPPSSDQCRQAPPWLPLPLPGFPAVVSTEAPAKQPLPAQSEIAKQRSPAWFAHCPGEVGSHWLWPLGSHRPGSRGPLGQQRGLKRSPTQKQAPPGAGCSRSVLLEVSLCWQKFLRG